MGGEEGERWKEGKEEEGGVEGGEEGEGEEEEEEEEKGRGFTTS